eukprot:COSAG01_NODE_62576_length_283_cov_509.298913_1_plen_32_part_10
MSQAVGPLFLRINSDNPVVVDQEWLGHFLGIC